MDPEALNIHCRDKKVGYISTATLGTWGYTFLDYGKEHIVTDHDGEQTKSFIVTMIEKGEKTKIIVHEDKRHSYHEEDYVVLHEVEGMVEINDT